MINYSNILLLSLIGLICGFLVSIVGGGGFSFLVPLILFLGILDNPQLATGTTLLAISVPITLIAALKYYKLKLVHVEYSVVMAIFLLIGVLIGNKYIHKVEIKQLRKIAGTLLITSGIFTLLKNRWD